MKEQCNKKKESKSDNISKKCFPKMRQTRKDKKLKRNHKDSKILKLSLITQKCLTNRSKIDKTKWNLEKLVHKSSWIKWLIMFSKRWRRSNNSKIKCLQDMKTKGKWDKDNSKREELWDKKKNKKKWDNTLLNKSKRKQTEKNMIELTLISKLLCGLSTNKTMTKRRKG